MMKSQVFKLCIREIKASFGRYMAIFAIIALGAGFFMGLRMSRPDFIETYDRYTQRFDFFNYRLVSTLGLTDDDLDLVRDMDFVTDAEGAKSADFMVRDGDDNLIIIAHSIPKRINKIDLIAGRMPEKPNECLADPEMYTEGDIGKTIKLSPDNGSATFDSFAYDSYTITGITESVSYINLERGSSTLGNGSVAGYIYIPEDGFALDCYTDIYLTLDISGYVYSDEYEENAEKYREPLESFMEERAKVRYDSIIDSATEALSEARAEYEKRSMSRPRQSTMRQGASLTRARQPPWPSLTKRKHSLNRRRQLRETRPQYSKSRMRSTRQEPSLMQGISNTNVG